MRENIRAIPTNIITGFLGVGKTTVIRHLLAKKPVAEKWAVLVNEFGEVGLDASLLTSEGKAQEKDGVFIREVPGGCMCCASGLPMQVALNQLISQSNPDRLIIEPTGLGHPKEVLSALEHSSYKGILNLQATLTLIDARKVLDPRYTEHETFKQQLQIADIIIANKSDLYGDENILSLQRYLTKLELDGVPLHTAIQGRIDSRWLNTTSSSVAKKIQSNEHRHLHSHPSNEGIFTQGIIDFPSAGFIRKDNVLDGYKSSGWIFESRFIFNREKLLAVFTGLEVERLKAIFITQQGVTSFNQVDGVLNYSAAVVTTDSRIEVIGHNEPAWKFLEASLIEAIYKS
jgi:G3E family GTPase